MPRNLSTSSRGYGSAYQRARKAILGPAGNGSLPFDPPCHWRHPGCAGIAVTADHEPPMEVTGVPHLNLVPACKPCNYGRRKQYLRPARRITAQPSRAW